MKQPPDSGLIEGSDGLMRCFWPGALPEYVAYHDKEWGRPVADDNRLFEKMCLEGFQSGLSWLTILRKREGFRAAFSGFDISKVARFSEADVARLLAAPAIVRHRAKIEAAINNARAAQILVEEAGSLASYVWRFEPKPLPAPDSLAALMARSIAPQAAAMSKDLKKRGFRFVGPTTMTALFQAAGLVNDHMAGCAHRSECEEDRKAFTRP